MPRKEFPARIKVAAFERSGGRSRDVTCAQCGEPFDRGYAINSRRAKRPQFCSRECQNAYSKAGAAARAQQRFWSHVEIGNEDDCWEWHSQRDKNGYGRFHFARKAGVTQLAHRHAVQFFAGITIPDGIVACHSCDNPGCVNPAHILLGSQADNVADMIAKGRKSPIGPRGVQVNTAKLTTQDVLTIRASAEKSKTLAGRFGVSRVQINNIRSGRQWRHV